MQLFCTGRELLEAGRSRRFIRGFDPLEGPLATALMRGRRLFVIYNVSAGEEELPPSDRSKLSMATLFIATQLIGQPLPNDDLQDFTAKYPENPTVLGLRAQQLTASLQFELARDMFDRLKAMAPRDAGMQAAYRQFLKWQDDFEEALRYPAIVMPMDGVLVSDLLRRANLLLGTNPAESLRIAMAVARHGANPDIRARAAILRLLVQQKTDVTGTSVAEPASHDRSDHASPTKGKVHAPDLEQAMRDTESVAIGLALLSQQTPADVYHATALQHVNQLQWAAAERCYRLARECDASHVNACNNLAWLLATCPDDSVRRPSEAVRLAVQACKLTKWSSSGELDTLAAACAAASEWLDAARWQQAAIDALPPNEHDRRARYRTQLAEYQQRASA